MAKDMKPILTRWPENEYMESGAPPKGKPWNVFVPDGTTVEVDGVVVPHGDNKFYRNREEALQAYPDAEDGGVY